MPTTPTDGAAANVPPQGFAADSDPPYGDDSGPCETCGGDGYTEAFNADQSDVVVTVCTDCGPGPGDFDA